MTNLRACPFCGRSDLLGVEPVAEGGFLAVKCRACGTHGPSKLAESEAEATAHWNRRADEPDGIDYKQRLEELENYAGVAWMPRMSGLSEKSGAVPVELDGKYPGVCVICQQYADDLNSHVCNAQNRSAANKKG